MPVQLQYSQLTVDKTNAADLTILISAMQTNIAVPQISSKTGKQ